MTTSLKVTQKLAQGTPNPQRKNNKSRLNVEMARWAQGPGAVPCVSNVGAAGHLRTGCGERCTSRTHERPLAECAAQRDHTQVPGTSPGQWHHLPVTGKGEASASELGAKYHLVGSKRNPLAQSQVLWEGGQGTSLPLKKTLRCRFTVHLPKPIQLHLRQSEK